ncbi:putative BRCT domain-containing protein [Lupinus albus]|uniref:Putative BRCT domain-containing protein n=1 Tax=Lupinus albus TaxID=3870 RepID=A0A6A4P5F3_LUPAL|nr:putative BRCT domain-containing protein [Lupinus albus]
MTESLYSFHSLSHSQPPSPHGGGNKDANEDEQFQETEIFEDTLVINNSPFTENLNLNTELVEDSDPEENMTSGAICEHEQEVVLDSEDEEMENGKVVTEDESSPALRNPLMRFQKRQMKPSREQAVSNATTPEKSSTGDKEVLTGSDRFYDNGHLCLPARLNHIHSPSPGDSTQDALGFVDRYLSSNSVDLFQGVQHRKGTRVKSPYVPSARGSLSLAKKIKVRTLKEEIEPFKLVESDQNDKGAGIFCKNSEASSNFKIYRETYTRRQKKGAHLQNQGNCSTGNGCEEKLVQGSGMITENNNPMKELDVQSSATRENVDAYSSVTNTEAMPDIGLDTQIAAEAMEALAYLSPSGSHFNDAHQPANALDGSLSDLTENESHLGISANRQKPGLQSITTKSNKRDVSSCSFSTVTSSSSCKNTDNQDPKLAFGKIKRILESKSNTEGHFENNTNSPISHEHVSSEQGCSPGEYKNFQRAAKEQKNWNNESRWTRIKDQPSHHTGRNNSVKEEGIIRHKRKENDLANDSLTLDVSTKYLKLPSNSCGVTRKSRLNHQVQTSPQLSACSSLLRIDSWLYPKRPRGKRKRLNVQIDLDAPSILCIVGKENVLSTRNLEGQDDVDESCLPHTHPLLKIPSIDNGECLLQWDSVQPGLPGDAMTFENMHEKHPLLLAHVEISSNKSIAKQSLENPAPDTSTEGVNISKAKQTYNEHKKKPYNKNLPKSPLFKELNRLGVSEFRQDLSWKDLRQRRDMTYVRVLFSQHLDDSVIKQQKKILARFNLSVASSSMEATHFVADKFTRTKNMLETMAFGKFVVTHFWLESCGQANCFIDEKKYILRDVQKEKEIGFSMPVSLIRAREKPLLMGKQVYITPHVKPDKEVLTSLITTVHGQVVDDSQICPDKNDKISDDLLILSCEDDYAICHHFLNRGVDTFGLLNKKCS